jgi:hypothetical protein
METLYRQQANRRLRTLLQYTCYSLQINILWARMNIVRVRIISLIASAYATDTPASSSIPSTALSRYKMCQKAENPFLPLVYAATYIYSRQDLKRGSNQEAL